jgi:hypothetical protein
MRINEVQAQVRYSSEVRGSWVTIELGSTASLTSSEETLESVSDELYKRLTKQLKVLWASGHPKDNGQEGRRIAAQPAQPHYCQEHQREFKRHEKDGNVWYSHRQGSGWHNE